MKVLAFDLGNVIFGFDYRVSLDKIKDKMEATVDQVIHSFYFEGFTIPFEKGLVSSDQFYSEFKKTFSVDISYDEFINSWCKIFFPKQEVINLISDLQKKYSVNLISNINELHFKYLHKKYPDIFSLFDNLILSFQVKSVKPETKIYDLLQKVSSVDFNDIIYIDDRADLISQAKLMGFQCIQFKDFNSLVNCLRDLGVEVAVDLQ